MKKKRPSSPKRKKSTSAKKPFRKRLRYPVLLACLFALTGMLLYCLFLAALIDKRFSGRRWSIPSKVYSDSTLLYPGQHLDKELLVKKLKNLGYRASESSVDQKGRYAVAPDGIRIYLHDLVTASQRRPGFPVHIRMDGTIIASITDLEYGEPVAVLEIEPEEIMLFYGAERERRKLVSIDRVPQHLIHAVLAAEDRRFYSHFGVDPRGILRAIYTNLRHGGIRAGGSTITQQLAKCYFLTPERTLIRKCKELFIALTMEAMYEKNIILEIYLNEIYLGQQGSVSINGIGEAAQFYFGKAAEHLSIAESATLAGLIKAPNLYSPYSHKERSLQRRNSVLNAMHTNNWLYAADLHKALQTHLETVGYAVRQRQAGYFIDYVSGQLKNLYSADDLASLGLSIYTSLDTWVQSAAEKALSNGLARLEETNPSLLRAEPGRRLQGAIIVMQPRTGAIRALVGGRNYAESQFNRITQARRQPGSAFKPLVYATALDSFTPSTLVSNAEKTYTVDGTPWTPDNFSEVLAETLPLRDAIAGSVNRPAVAVAMQAGLDNIIQTARTMGITTEFKPYPSLALGSFEVIPLELARAYCCFAADGMLPYPLAVKDVVNDRGSVLQRTHIEIVQAVSPAKAFIMNSLLKSVVTDGTARSLHDLDITFPAAGKTGTTDNYRDAWFIGYTPDLLALIWVGFDDGTSIQATGAGAAVPIWAELMSALTPHISGSWFMPPPGIVQKVICPQTGMLAKSETCPNPGKEYFIENLAPSKPCRRPHTKNPLHKIMKGIHGIFKKR